MKRRDLLSHLIAHGGARVAVIPGGATQAQTGGVPFQDKTSSNHLAVKICRDLGVPEPNKF